MDMYPRTSSFLDRNPYKILATKDNLVSVSYLLPKVKIWNHQPRENALETLTYVYKHIILFIFSRNGVNLPITILNFSRKKIIASHEGLSSPIHFGRVLSELFLQQGIVENVQEVGLAEALETRWSGSSKKLRTLQCWILSILVSPLPGFLLLLSSYFLASFVLFCSSMIFFLFSHFFYSLFCIFLVCYFAFIFLTDDKRGENEYDFDIFCDPNET